MDRAAVPSHSRDGADTGHTMQKTATTPAAHGLLLIGSTGRNSGKTEFACSLLARFGTDFPVVGVKATVIRSREDTCPRGGEGCGVCASLEGEFCITEEMDRHGPKDTSRLLRAGATRVFWLRVMRAHMAEGFSALRSLIGEDAIVVCESNSLRHVVEPDVFLMVHNQGNAAPKPTAAAVAGRVDRTVVSDGRGFDLELRDISLRNGRWALREHATAIVLAGGASKRMGRDKRMLSIDGQPMIAYVCNQLRDHFDEVLVSANDAHQLRSLGAKVVADRTPGLGPMEGIASALDASSHELCLVVACDIPRLDLTLARRMLAQAAGADAVVPRLRPPASRGGEPLLEPLFAVYRKSTARHIQHLLDDGVRQVRELFSHCRTRFIDMDDGFALANLNTEEDYRTYVAVADAHV